MASNSDYPVHGGREPTLPRTSKVLVLGEGHLRKSLKSYREYYHRSRTHLALGKDAPEEYLSRQQDVIVAADFFTVEAWTRNGLTRIPGALSN
jgi:hypothetical protein